jgi:hypothetical protein
MISWRASPKVSDQRLRPSHEMLCTWSRRERHTDSLVALFKIVDGGRRAMRVQVNSDGEMARFRPAILVGRNKRITICRCLNRAGEISAAVREQSAFVHEDLIFGNVSAQ